MRALVLIHRYLGIAVGAVMLMWCLSGAVMMYVPYPELSSAERMRHLSPLRWQDCCVIPDEVLADRASVSQFQLERMGDRTVLRIRSDGRSSVIDLTGGHPMGMLSAPGAQEVAVTYARASGFAGRPSLLGLLGHDQWTMSGVPGAARPLYWFELGDSAGTHLYVSAWTGQVVQVTTAHQRFWSWLGAIPHWLYFSGLRSHAAVWTKVVIGVSLAGCALTLLGLCIGVQRMAAGRAGRWSPYRGVLLWHHLPGLIFGPFLLTWVASGLVSMNPWGFLDSDSGAIARRVLRGAPLTGAQVKAAIRSLPALGGHPGIVSVASEPLAGALYLTAVAADGTRVRLDATGRIAPVTDSDWGRIAVLLGGTRPADGQLLPQGDAYRLGGPPVYRIISGDEEHTRCYLDPTTAALLACFDRNARWYRWLHQGMHAFDFTAVLRARPLWDILLWVLLTGAAVISATGLYRGARRLGMRHTPRVSRTR